MSMIITTVEFDDKKVDIEHNLNEYGLDINDGLMNWFYRRDPDERTPENLCDYLVSKNPEWLEARPVG